ncbi:hypothetical protein IAT40_000269 [Kwoniella sp. CBS 6097]
MNLLFPPEYRSDVPRSPSPSPLPSPVLCHAVGDEDGQAGEDYKGRLCDPLDVDIPGFPIVREGLEVSFEVDVDVDVDLDEDLFEGGSSEFGHDR